MPTLYSAACATFAHRKSDTKSAIALRMKFSLRIDDAELHAFRLVA
jgi:hypothetical protein